MINHLEILIDLNQKTDSDICIARLVGLGFDGFEERGEQLLAFIREDLFDAPAMILTIASYMKDYTKSSIPEKNWNEL